MKELRGLRRYPSAIVGMVLIAILAVTSIYTVIAIPYNEAIERWRSSEAWLENPARVPPAWLNLFTKDKIPRTFVITLENATLTEEPIGDGMKRVEIVLPFEYYYDRFPSELQLMMHWTFGAPPKTMSLYWRRPDGQTVTLDPAHKFTPPKASVSTYFISQDWALETALGNVPVHEGLLAVDSLAPARELLRGKYELVLQTELREGEELREARLRVFGRVYGWAGTDQNRRDLMLPLLWGAPIALVFGLLAAIGTQLSHFVLAGIATWFGGKLEAILHRLTELSMILPNLPILIMIGFFYEMTIWRLLGLVIALNIFGGSIKVYRAMFLQLKEAPYIEAAQAYGVGSFRMIFRYLLPRMTPTLLPQFVVIVPTFVFLEASLAVLGLGDPFLPTWGKVIFDAQTNYALNTGRYYWVLEPSILLMTIGFGFAMVGYSLDRVFNPRLRTM